MKQTLIYAIALTIMSWGVVDGQVLWNETFTDPDPLLGSTVDNGATAWSTTQPPNGTFATANVLGADVFLVNNTDGEGVWISEWIDISLTGYALLDLDVGSGFTGTGDYLRVYYSVNNGPDSLFFAIEGSFLAIDATGTGVVQGDSVRITMRSTNDGSFFGLDSYTLDNVSVTAVTTLYSRKSGDWDDATPGNGTWSAVGLGGASCDCIPTNTTRVEIGNLNTVSINVAGSTTEVLVLNNGTLQWSSASTLSLRGNFLVNSGGTVSLNANTGAITNLGFNIPYLIDNEGDFDAGVVAMNDDGALVFRSDGNTSFEDLDLNGNGAITFSGDSGINISDDILVGDDATITNNLNDTLAIGDQINFESIVGNNSSVFVNNGNMTVGNRIFIDDDDPSITNNGTLLIVNDIQTGASNDDNWDFTNTGILEFTRLAAANSNFVFNNSGTVTNVFFVEMNGTESINNNTPGVWNYQGNFVGANTELFCDIDGVNSFNYTRSGIQPIITPQDSYWNLSLSGSGAKSMQGNFDVKGDISLASPATFSAGTNTLTLDGTVAQNISNSSSAALSFYGLVFNNSSGSNPAIVFGNNIGAISVTNNVDFTSGVIEIQNNNNGGLSINSTATFSGGSASCYVDGMITKIGTDAYEFPVGDGSIWAPVSISAPYTAGASFSAQYFDGTFSPNTTDGSFSHISGIEYWTIDRNVSMDSVSVTLFWKDDVRSDILEDTDLIVSRFNSGPMQWVNEGRSASSGGAQGFVVSDPVTDFSFFTFGTLIGANPLPVELISFNATPSDEGVLLEWVVENETNLNAYEVYRSSNGVDLNFVGSTPRANDQGSFTINYAITDKDPLNGLSYYHLFKIEDGLPKVQLDITTAYLEQVSRAGEISIYPNPAHEGFYINKTTGAFSGTVQIFNNSGSLVEKFNTEFVDPYWIDNHFASGQYTVRLIDEDGQVFVKRVLISD